MRIGRIHSYKKVIAQLLLLVLPTAALMYYDFWDANRFFAILQNDWLLQGSYFLAGLALSTIFYSYRFRFITTAAVLAAILLLAYKLLGVVVVTEFGFLITIQFYIFCTIFCAAWMVGYGFSRARWFTILWSILLLVLQVLIVSKTADIKASALIGAFIPVLAYAVYIIYTAELIRNMNEDGPGFGWFVGKRMIGFAVVLALLLAGTFTYFQKDFKAIETEWGGMKPDYNKKGNSESMTKQDKDGTIRNKDQTRLTGSLNKGKRLVFVAKLDNFLPDGVTPNPLYFTAYYYTKFDTLTQTFEMDTAHMPSNDLFKPDPSKIPLYFTRTDSTVIKNTHATLNRKVVNADVYKVLLSPTEYLAPSTAFSCQPIGVPKEYQQQYASAYRAKMWVSDLNSAYFIYNPAGNKSLEAFQQQRFDLLRRIKDFQGMDKTFYDYYTFMPKNEEYKKITELAKQITANAKTPIDKMLAIRNYFLGKDEFGQPLFKYSDNPGIPGIPSASKLTYFLFENRKGYCAYFAGATLFMLRSLGIPSRLAAGFLTIDRSSKNPGWYWFYEDQAHAWVQAYFPGYGWMDFDTTIPDVNTQQASQPDQTPPLDMQQVYLVADGEVTNVDTVGKLVQMKVKNLLYHDQNYTTTMALDLLTDASRATVSADTATVPLSALKKGMHITAASYAAVLKNIEATSTDSMLSIFKKIPSPVPVDEIKIIEKDQAKKINKKEQLASSKPVDWVKMMWASLAAVGTFILLLFLTPYFIWVYYNSRAKKNDSDTRLAAFNKYRAVSYYLNQLGYSRTMLGPQQYALQTDTHFGTRFSPFIAVYQKAKYSSAPLTPGEEEIVAHFYSNFISQVNKNVPFKVRVNRFLNIYNTIGYFSQPK